MQNLRLFVAAVIILANSIPAAAQDPLKALLKGGKGSSSDSGNNSIEGVIWEYKGKLKTPPKDLKEGEEAPVLEGRFRTEKKAIFDVSKRLAIPEKKEVDKVTESIKAGKAKEIKLPEAPHEKRLGQYRQLDNDNKLRLDFDDKESLNGIMIIWHKQKTDDVWIGTFAQKLPDTKEVRNWIVEVRPIED